MEVITIDNYITSLTDLYDKISSAQESSIKYMLNRNKDIANITDLNDILTKAVNVRNKKNPLIINLSDNDLKQLMNKYVGNNNELIKFSDVYKYISLNEIKNRLVQNINQQFKQLLTNFHYTPKSAKLLLYNSDEIIKPYFFNYLLPLIKQNIPIDVNVNLTYDINMLDSELLNFLEDHLNEAINEYINELNNSNKLRLDGYLKNNNDTFQIAKKKLIHIICSKKCFDTYIKNNKLKKKQIKEIKPGYIVNYYSKLIFEYLTKTLKADINSSPLFKEDVLKYLEQDNDYNLSFFRTLNEYIIPDTRNKIKVLEEKDELIGEETDINISKLDIDNRERPFVIINKEFFMGRPGESHAHLVQRLQQNNEKNTAFRRNNININAKSLAFGHVVNKLAFVEKHGMNISIEEIIIVLKSTNYFKKIYTVPNNNSVIRLAKKIK